MTGSRVLMLVLVLVAVVAGLLYRGSSTPAALPYVADWDEAVAEARATGKPLLVSFGGPW